MPAMKSTANCLPACLAGRSDEFCPLATRHGDFGKGLEILFAIAAQAQVFGFDRELGRGRARSCVGLRAAVVIAVQPQIVTSGRGMAIEVILTQVHIFIAAARTARRSVRPGRPSDVLPGLIFEEIRVVKAEDRCKPRDARRSAAFDGPGPRPRSPSKTTCHASSGSGQPSVVRIGCRPRPRGPRTVSLSATMNRHAIAAQGPMTDRRGKARNASWLRSRLIGPPTSPQEPLSEAPEVRGKCGSKSRAR